MPTPTATDVNETQKFTATKVVVEPRPTFKSAPKVRPNPFTGLPLTGSYAQKHHTVGEAPETVKDATQSNPV
jgi:hypothetical protein